MHAVVTDNFFGTLLAEHKGSDKMEACTAISEKLLLEGNYQLLQTFLQKGM